MVQYCFKVYIPSLDRRVSFREITIREFININKSLMNNDRDEIIECFDSMVYTCCIESDIVFTLLDKIIILFAIRAYSVSTFCDLKITDKDEGKEFDHKLELNKLLDTLLTFNVSSKHVIKQNDITIEYGIPFIPVVDINIINVANYLHSIRTAENNILIDHTNTVKEIQQVVDLLDVDIFNQITEYAKILNTYFQDHPLYTIYSPFTFNKLLVTQRMSLDFTMYDMLKMLFTENLHNLYRTIFNFNQTLNISPLYTENLIPTEKDLLWGYYLKDQRDAESRKNMSPKTGSFQPN